MQAQVAYEVMAQGSGGKLIRYLPITYLIRYLPINYLIRYLGMSSWLKEAEESTKMAQRRAPPRLLRSVCFALFVLLHYWMLSLATHIIVHPSTPTHINPHAATSRYILHTYCMQCVCVCVVVCVHVCVASDLWCVVCVCVCVCV
jgi:hypothetical protein